LSLQLKKARRLTLTRKGEGKRNRKILKYATGQAKRQEYSDVRTVGGKKTRKGSRKKEREKGDRNSLEEMEYQRDSNRS